MYRGRGGVASTTILKRSTMLTHSRGNVEKLIARGERDNGMQQITFPELDNGQDTPHRQLHRNNNKLRDGESSPAGVKAMRARRCLIAALHAFCSALIGSGALLSSSRSSSAMLQHDSCTIER